MTKLIIVTDPGKDPDDENTLVLVRWLMDQALAELVAVLAVLAPSKQRARLAKGTLNKLLLTAPVGIGSDCTVTDTGASDHEFQGVDYLAPEEELEDGQVLLVRKLKEADPKSIVWLIIAGQTDVAKLLREHEQLFSEKTDRVVIMGGVKRENAAALLNADGFMEPDTAANNEFDADSAAFFYRRLQELSIPMTVLMPKAAYACKIPVHHYERLAATGNAVGIKLKASHKQLIEALWQRVNYEPDDPRREKLPARCNKLWFLNTFCGGKGEERTSTDSIWDIVQTFNLYDPMACLAAVPSLCERFYEPEVVTVNNVEHRIIGISAEKIGVKDAAAVVQYLTDSILCALKSVSVEETPAS